MKREEAIAELQLRRIADMAQWNYSAAEALAVAIRSMEMWETVKEHMKKHDFVLDHGDAYGIHVSKSFIQEFIFEREQLDFYVQMEGDSNETD